jgi:hypothetical protein
MSTEESEFERLRERHFAEFQRITEDISRRFFQAYDASLEQFGRNLVAALERAIAAREQPTADERRDH